MQLFLHTRLNIRFPPDRSLCVCMCMCMYVYVYVCASFDAPSIRACFSEMAEWIWTRLGSFESSYWVIDQVRRSHGGDIRFRRYNRLSDVSDKLALFSLRACFSEMAERIWTNLGSF